MSYSVCCWTLVLLSRSVVSLQCFFIEVGADFALSSLIYTATLVEKNHFLQLCLECAVIVTAGITCATGICSWRQNTGSPRARSGSICLGRVHLLVHRQPLSCLTLHDISGVWALWCLVHKGINECSVFKDPMSRMRISHYKARQVDRNSVSTAYLPLTFFCLWFS